MRESAQGCSGTIRRFSPHSPFKADSSRFIKLSPAVSCPVLPRLALRIHIGVGPSCAVSVPGTPQFSVVIAGYLGISFISRNPLLLATPNCSDSYRWFVFNAFKSEPEGVEELRCWRGACKACSSFRSVAMKSASHSRGLKETESRQGGLCQADGKPESAIVGP